MNKRRLQCELCGKQRRSLFCALTEPDRQSLDLNKTVQIYDAGQHLFDEGNPSFAVYCIHEGRVKVYKADEKGERHVLRLLGKSDIVGFQGILADEPYAATAEAIEKTVACVIPRDIFIDLLHESSNLAFDLMAKLAEELRISEDQMLSLLRHPLRRRVARLLIELSENMNSGKLKVASLKRMDMAQIIGTTPESLSRTLREFASRDLIDVTYSEIRISNRAALEKIAGIEKQ